MSREVQPDGSVVYRYKGHGPIRYKPVGGRQSHKPDDPRAVRFHTKWFLPLELADDDRRHMPETRPDDEAVGHKMLCACDVCKRPAALRLKQRAAGLRL